MAEPQKRRRLWHLLLIAPFIGTLWVPFYNDVQPKLGGVPFFYWYQFLWVAISTALTAVVYFMTREPEAKAPEVRAKDLVRPDGDAGEPGDR